MMKEAIGGSMAEILLPEKEVFERRVQAVSNRIATISEHNTMAKLLHSNFTNWLNNSSMSPVKLTQDLDEDKNGTISGDEFATLLGKMTGERPPDWVVEVVFSFVEADTSAGIPISDWMAFLAASGLEVPEALFEKPVIITGSLLVDKPQTHVGESITITASFNEPVDAYELKVTSSIGESETFLTQQAEMDSPTFDEFILDADSSAEYTVELLHVGVRLDSATFEITEPPIAEPEPTTEDLTTEEVQEQMPEPTFEHAEHGGLSELHDTLAAMRLRSETEACIARTPPYEVRFHIQALSRTLLGEGAYKNGSTLTCSGDDGTLFDLMVPHSDERTFAVGDRCNAVVQPHGWSVALRRMVCLQR